MMQTTSLSVCPYVYLFSSAPKAPAPTGATEEKTTVLLQIFCVNTIAYPSRSSRMETGHVPAFDLAKNPVIPEDDISDFPIDAEANVVHIAPSSCCTSSIFSFSLLPSGSPAPSIGSPIRLFTQPRSNNLFNSLPSSTPFLSRHLFPLPDQWQSPSTSKTSVFIAIGLAWYTAVFFLIPGFSGSHQMVASKLKLSGKNLLKNPKSYQKLLPLTVVPPLEKHPRLSECSRIQIRTHSQFTPTGHWQCPENYSESEHNHPPLTGGCGRRKRMGH